MPGFALGANRSKHSGGISETHIFSPTIVLESRFGVNMTDQHLSFGNTTDPKSLGMQPIAGVTQIDGLPQVNIANYVNGGFGNNALWHDNIKTFTGSATMTWLRNKHTIKFGGTWRVNRASLFRATFPSGQFQFSEGSGYRFPAQGGWGLYYAAGQTIQRL